MGREGDVREREKNKKQKENKEKKTIRGNNKPRKGKQNNTRHNITGDDNRHCRAWVETRQLDYTYKHRKRRHDSTVRGRENDSGTREGGKKPGRPN